jgi:hypothetical protein
VKLSLEHELALKSALLLPEEAEHHWRELLSRTPFDELEGSTYRIVSAVYKNLEKFKTLPDYERLRGAYRFNWARNSRFLSAILPIIRELETKKANYRILKGSALNLLNDALGIRTMGDIDLLISIEELPLLIKLFEEHGFEKKYDTKCPNSPENVLDNELCFINSDNVEVDLHLAEKSYPSRLFQNMLKTPPEIYFFMSTPMKLPSYELALVHTAIHGYQSVSDSDQMQSLIDCSQLLPFIDPKRLAKLNRSLDTDFAVVDYLETVYKVIGTTYPLSRMSQTFLVKKLSHLRFLYVNKLLKSSNTLMLVRSRKIFPRELDFVKNEFCGKSFVYFLWLKYGQLRPIERIAIRFFGGFMNSPAEKIKTGNLASGFAKNQVDWINFSNCPVESNDWRFSIRGPEDLNSCIVQMFSDAFKEWNWVIFVNGKLAGTSPRNPDGVYSIILKNPQEKMEISIRSPLHICKLCYRDLSDLRIYVL